MRNPKLRVSAPGTTAQSVLRVTTVRADPWQMSEHPVAGQDFAGSNTRMLVEHVQRRLGDEGVDALVACAGDRRTRAQLFDDGIWSTYAQFRRLLEVAAELLGGVEGFAGIGADADIGGGTAPEITAILQTLGSPIA